MEILLLSGGTPHANFKELAYAWGREKGFHHVLANSVCERRGEVERKKRSDAGKSMTDEEKIAFRSKLQKSRDKNGTSKKAKKGGEEEAKEEGDIVAGMQPQSYEHQHHSVAVGIDEQPHHMNSPEPLITVDGGPMVEETVAESHNHMETTTGISEIVRTMEVEAPALMQVAPSENGLLESSGPVVEDQIPNATPASVAEI